MQQIITWYAIAVTVVLALFMTLMLIPHVHEATLEWCTERLPYQMPVDIQEPLPYMQPTVAEL